MGRLTGKSTANKRPSFNQNNSLSSGKVDIKAAEKQSLISGNVNNIDNNYDKVDLIFSSYKNIYVETISWIEVIRRKYEFANEKKATKPPPVELLPHHRTFFYYNYSIHLLYLVENNFDL